ncbi:hypothetical protein Hypma_000540 [Hypsizygus marmoreus]|uniref:F-box domain-containing protein n=1 Tax=Hypsizygus marmoreus TaxID=39966 RepID=A0A369JAP7_HYPMA|nr:hypothetical protein Hypma_000540 [Hypsizygus marmoreus]
MDDDSRSLAHLARTCWSFSDPALDILWRSQPNLWQLIHVMPSDLWVATTENAFPEDEVDEDDDFAVFFQVINFVRELRATDWERFDYYGRKIQALEYPNDDISNDINEDTVTVHEDILAALSSYRPVLNPLPNLKKLTLNLNLPHVPKCIPFIQCFLGPSITRIVVIMDHSDTMYPLYSMMSRLCPNIQTIRIHESSEMSDYSLDIFQLVSTSQHLVDVQFGHWIVPTPDVILHMGRLSSLRSWTEFRLPVGDDLLLFTTNDGQFSNLRVFGCYSYFERDASKVMDSMKCPFESLSLQLLMYSELPPTELISSMLRNHALPLSLTRFQLLSGDHRIPPGHAVDVYQSFEPLFTLRALQSLDIQLSPHHALGDSWLAAASRSWPLLQTLLIRTTVTRNATMTLGGLVPLVQGTSGNLQ